MKALYFAIMALITFSCAANPNNTKLPCEGATNSLELEQCIAQKKGESDQRLTNELRLLRKRIQMAYAAEAELGNTLIDQVEKTQLAWSDFKAQSCQLEAFEIEQGTSAYETVINNCKLRMNQTRIKALSQVLN
ncbi:lysozyme inhibitor LprI family protein [Pseudoalteromonas sp. SW0106-04]|uniref:lysozyme inhibitor LprI family protein n=1 Tax=Pseudoalteromonas sp. SW0106-04 TaxID=1702169 RepID=UPI0006B596B8|nr:lysozyme inhibitor LprI family protein [Pseudoalteromonas sp. SW0106-04]